MQTLRTSDERFAHLRDAGGTDGFDYEPHHAEVADPTGGGPIRMAWVEDGPADGPVVLLLHGEPSWSYLYRSMIPPLAAAGLRVVAPDLVGFGRSDKPVEVADHTYARHVEWVRELVLDRLGLDAITLVGQDWGGLIGLRLAAENPARFARLVAANTGLPTGDVDMPEIWHRFRRAVQESPRLDIARFVESGCVRGLSPVARSAYDAPFPDETFTAGPRAMPGLVPYRPDDPASAANRAAWAVLAASTIPMLVAFSDSDPITGGMRPVLERTVPGAAGRTHPVIANAGHFLQEDAGAELADAVATFIRTSG
ncbi:haloalkane dehalogenase [uncultured Jatrophihabitans sp.]|uniref:haloalkane dehalogenase n=1 Tax=uncultured Jatrophihabitans sp. TaxID=1610747 RepID=UPI0035CBA195